MNPPSLILHLSSSQLVAIAFWFRLLWLGNIAGGALAAVGYRLANPDEFSEEPS